MPCLKRTLLACLLIIFLLTACEAKKGQGQSQITSHNSYHLTKTSDIGQTFVSRYSGLHSISIYLMPDTLKASDNIIFHLRDNPLSSVDLLQVKTPISAIRKAGYYHFIFTPQANSYLRSYYMLLEIEGDSAIRIGTANENTYIDGALYQNGIPFDQQLSFMLGYSVPWLILGLLKQALNWLWCLLLSLVFILPGWGLLSAFWPDWNLKRGIEKFCLAAGLSLGLFPILILLSYSIHLQFGAMYAWGPLILSATYLIWRNRSEITIRKIFIVPNWLEWENLNLAVVLFFIVIVRLWVIRGIEYPMWGDSYQHTAIAQLLLDNKGLFQSWLPYAPYKTLTVQYGFPAYVAIFSWLSKMPAAQACLWTGQIINFIAIIGIYPLALRLSNGNKWIGTLTLLIAGLLMPLPMMYLNWGRYAQLAGQAILPVLIYLGWDTFDGSPFDLRKILITGIVLAGMLITYYRMIFYFSTFFIAWLLFWAISNLKISWKKWQIFFTTAIATALTSLLIVLPWLIHVYGSTLSLGVESGLTTSSPIENIRLDYLVWKEVSNFVPIYLIILSVIALLWAIIKRKWMIGGIGFWIILISAVKAGQTIHLPGANMMQSFAVLIFLYIPMSLLAGWLAGQIAQWFENSKVLYARVYLSLFLIGLSAWGGYSLKSIVSPADYSLVTRPDSRAMDWIEKNIPSDAIFLVEGFRIYDGKSAVGSDAGWWLPLLTGRRNTMPPQYALLNEVSDPVDYSKKVIDLVATLEQNSPGSSIGLHAICSMNVTHIYIGQGEGMIGSGARQLFNRESLQTSGFFDELYHQDRISIFSIKPNACKNTQSWNFYNRTLQ